LDKDGQVCTFRLSPPAPGHYTILCFVDGRFTIRRDMVRIPIDIGHHSEMISDAIPI